MSPAKFLRYLPLILFACSTVFANTLETNESLKTRFAFSFNDIQDYLVVVEHDQAVGSGFVAKMNNRYYIFTNQHVILGGERIRFKTVSGKALRPKKVELSATRDIARLLLDTDSGLEISSSPEIDSAVAVFGNSDGAGVATELYGEVKSVSTALVEVTADFVSGNSGSPVLNTAQEVIGIASYVRYSSDKRTKEGEEPEIKTRRFCYRLTGTKWKSVDWKKYNEKYGAASLKNSAMIDDIFEIAGAWYDNPFGKLSTEDHSDLSLQKWSKNHNNMIKRIERMLEKGSATQSQLDNINKQIRNDLIDSAEAFSEVCQHRERQMRFFAEQKELTGFLKSEFIQLAERLEYANEQLEDFAEELESFNYFHFK